MHYNCLKYFYKNNEILYLLFMRKDNKTIHNFDTYCKVTKLQLRVISVNYSPSMHISKAESLKYLN